MVDLIQIAIGLVIIVGIVFPIYHFYSRKKEKELEVRLLLFSHIGKDKVFVGSLIGKESNDAKIGVYTKFKGRKVAITDVDPADYFSDGKYSKCLLVCKYGEDDYRVMSRMTSGNWFKMVQVPLKEKVPNPNYDPNDPSSKSDLEVVIYDKDGNPQYESVFEPYEESIGVDQDSRTAIRFNRIFNNRMDELMKEKKSMFEKILPIAGVIFVGILLLIGGIYMNKTHKEVMIKVSDDFREGAQDYNSDNFFARLTDWAENRGGDSNDPNK